MGSDFFEISVNFIKMALIFIVMVATVPFLVWLERRVSAFMQNRLGPNRIGPLGLTQLLADFIKFIFKEEFIPARGKKFLFIAAPIVALIPAGLSMAAIPLSYPLSVAHFELFGQSFGPYKFLIQGFEIGIGIVFVLGASSLATYSILMAGWSSGSKYSLYGALRASAQMISYELALGLSLVGVLLIYNTFDFSQMIATQTGPLSFVFFGESLVVNWLPNWGIFYQPLGAFLFLVAIFAETNRLPFDLPEAEAELVAGYHTEYGGIKMNMFYIGEYGHMMVASALMATIYFGGYNLPFITPEEIKVFLIHQGLSDSLVSAATSIFLLAVFTFKVFFFLWIFIWVRWSLPRFRYDQLMDLGWKTMLPWALGNTAVTAILIFLMRTQI